MEKSYWEQAHLQLPLKYTWKISRNASTEKINVIVFLCIDGRTYPGEAAPNVRYGESVELIDLQFKHFQTVWKDSLLQDEHAYNDVLDGLKLCQSLRFALESAYVHARCDKDPAFFERYTGIKMHTSPLATSYTLPIMDPGQIQEFIQTHDLTRFDTLKIKTGKEESKELIKTASRYFDKMIRVDANEAWTDPDLLIKELEELKRIPLEFIEQPFESAQKDAYKYFKKYSKIPVIADESITFAPDLKEIKELFHGVNMKLMKAGGYREGANILLKSKELGLKTMVGCMVETTLGIRSGMWISGHSDYIDLDGSFVIDNEPFKLVSENLGRLVIKQVNFFIEKWQK
ncbi:dipeptide epimerase [Cytophaga hutchinsonii]|uniref:Dipeptide epimerase n=2 Tax=Cytophaga hutchinsonii TaxID=985 RepID=A0A6N4SRG6_CYTH3|nr:dipeptide epimerase [Cytophaga hutchinsonii]ABG58938.1 L-alanine-DL-glutamate epimerase [Cytophaga hutchinsonii ATCC 33406]SFX82408.1 glutamate racemase [Cytophaga hutchinsonii ATCC 33406]